MWPTSDQYDPAYRGGGEVVAVAEVWRNNVRQTLPDGSTSLILAATEGQDQAGEVTVAESSKVRRTMRLSVGNVDLDPQGAGDLLSPFGTDIRLYSGIVLTDGTVESVPVGHFRITSPGRSSVFSPLTLVGNDYGAVLAQARFIVPWNTPYGRLVTDEISFMARTAVPWLTVIDLTGSQRITVPATWQRDRWDAILNLTDSIGAEPVFDPLGRLILRPVPTGSGTPVWSCNSGTNTANMLDLATGLNADGVYNAVVASTSAPGAEPISGIAYQQSGDLAYVPGVFERPRFYSSPQLTTLEQCYGAATSILQRSLAYSQQLDPTSAPNPALDAGDLIAVNGIPRIVSGYNLPIGAGDMKVTTRVGADIALTQYSGGLS